MSLACALLYAALAPRVSGDGDGAELTLVLATGGVAHPTGYPLYTLMGHGFVLLLHALGAGWARAANLFSALGAALAVGMLHALALRLLPASRAPGRVRTALALLPTALFALCPLWTYEATLAEVYTWHLAWLCGAALLFLEALDALATRPAPGRVRALAGAWGLLVGVGAAHHATSVLASLALSGALLWRTPPALRARALAVALPAALLPLLAYAYVFWRALHPGGVQWPTLQASTASALAHVTGSLYRGYLGGFEPSEAQRDLMLRYLWPLLVPALLAAAVRCLQVRGAEALRVRALAGAALALLLYAFMYRVPDPAPYFLGPLALGLALGLPLLAPLASSARGRRGLAVMGVVLLGVGAHWVTVAQQRRQFFESFDARLRRMWQSVRFEQAIVLFQDDMAFKLREYQVLGGEKPGVDVVTSSLLLQPGPREAFRARHGFDPLEGLDDPARVARPGYVLGDASPEKAQLFARVHENIAARARVPVVGFDPQRGSVRLFRPPQR